MKKCTVDGCEKKHVAKGYCANHYYRWKSNSNPLIDGRKNKPVKVCSIDGCNNKHRGSGFCNKHYLRFKNHGDPNAIKKVRQDGCDVVECKDKHFSKGFCRTHYNNFRSTGNPLIVKRRGKQIEKCTVDGCDNKYFSSGYCRRHYAKLSKRGQCSMEGCEKHLHSKKYCQMHYARWRKYGNPNVVHAIVNSICKINGCSNKSRKNGYCESHYMKSDLAQKRYRTAAAKRRSTKLHAPINDFTTQDWLDCLDFFNHECAYCGTKKEKLQVEHVTPLSRNGSHTRTNIVPSCNKCNRNKFTKTLDEWYPHQKYYSKDKEKKMHSWLGYQLKGNTIQIALF